MKIEFDTVKNETNIKDRGLPFQNAVEFDFDNSIVWQDTRKAYPEIRFLAVGYLKNRLHVICFSPIEEGIRVISFRKANTREGKKHGLPITRD